MQKKGFLAVGLVAALYAAPAMAQDSVSSTGCLPGDAVSPWDVTEQCNDFVVDLTPFETSKGTKFGIAPILKSSKSEAAFFSSLQSAQGISRKLLTDVAINDLPSSGYGFWDVQGAGVNGQENDPPLSMLLPSHPTVQFGAGFAEFSGNYNGVISGIVNIDPCEPTRLYVCRRQAATNGCDANSDLAQFGFGSVDADGTVLVRYDEFSSGTLGGCGVPLADSVADNIIRVRTGARDCDSLNVVSGTYPGLFDTNAVAATDLLVTAFSTETVNPPSLIPASVTGAGKAFYIGTNFLPQYVRGLNPPVTGDTTHLAPGVPDQRGLLSYSCNDCGLLNSSAGVAGILAKDAAFVTAVINLFGLDNAGNVTGTLAVPLPAMVTDPCAPAPRRNVLDAGGNPNEFDHYHSQTAYRGGNGQVAIGSDVNGNLIAAAQVTQPSYISAADPFGYILAARINCNSGATDYVMAGYNLYADPNSPTGAIPRGKEICDASGAIIGEMTGLFNVTGGTPVGPSFSAPTVDARGNIWFLTAMQVYVGARDLAPGGDDIWTSGLVRATLDETNFCYNLELVFKLGDEFQGQNSDTPWLISFLSIADGDSVSSGTMWSQNISDEAHMGLDPTKFASPADPRSLGGIVVAAEIQYDVNGDGMYDGADCTASGSTDEEYNVLLYVGSTTSAGDFDGDGDVDLSDFGNGFALCFGGPNVPPPATCPSSVNADFDHDGDVDLSDFSKFSLMFTGSL